MMPVNMWRCSGTTVHKPDSGSRGPVSRPKWVIMLGRALKLVTVPLYTLRYMYKWVQVITVVGKLEKCQGVNCDR